MRERLFGIETEYALSVLRSERSADGDDDLLRALMGRVRQTHPHLPAHHSGVFLSNGARLYVDCGGHPEYCTPECTSPDEVVRHVLAGDRILGELVGQLAGDRRGLALVLSKVNVDYGALTTWGSHESYLHAGRPAVLPRELVPHLVSRLIYTGAGGFDIRHPGLCFLLSPRVPYLESTVSGDSTRNRAIFHAKDESLARPTDHRLHVICGESLCSERASLLRVGATALVLALIEAGERPGHSVALVAPLEAMRTFAADPELVAAVPLAGGGQITAEAIQRHYLECVERHLGAPFLPPWAEPVCRAWREVLDGLRDRAPVLDSVLDWRIKRAIFEQHARKRGFPRDVVARWNDALTGGVERAPEQSLLERQILAELSGVPPCFPRVDKKRLKAALADAALDRGRLESFLRLRRELFELDVRFSQVGDDGLFARLDRAGVLHHHLEGLGDVDAARNTPPPGSRASVRGRVVRMLAARREKAVCDWSTVVRPKTGQCLDLSDPFVLEERWSSSPPPAPEPF
ncbi:MAG: proteasome accessory factor PafA2 family protein [Planctomycetes bacterium]|nr:proteasome accessory factor PafA2 family protein [Planctomycetota bacterium]